jgi:transglutaminase-like putative cysteine protease
VSGLRLPRLLPPSPIEESAAARACAFAGFAFAAASIVLYGQDYLVPPVAACVCALGHVVSWRGRRRPRRNRGQALIAGLIFLCLAYLLLDSVAALFGGQLPQANFALLLVAVTSFDLKTRRNLYSSLWISLAVLYLAAVYAWDYQFGVLVALWAACLVGFWAASHLRRIEALPKLPVRPLAVAGAAAVLGGCLLFVVLPQPDGAPQGPLIVSLPSYAQFQGEIENPALPLIQVGGDQSGSSSRVDLRYRGRLGSDVVMYVRTGAPAYWRGVVFDRYANGAWTATHDEMRTYPAYVSPEKFPHPEGPQLGTFVQIVRVVRPLPGVIYAASPIESLYFPAAQVREDAYGSFRAPEPLKPGQTYSVVSYLPNYSGDVLAHDDPDYPQQVDSATRDPGPLSGRARQLAVSAVAGAETRYERVMALTRYLQAHYQYSLELGHVPPGEDPVDWFLFDARIGYCEQFATAETLMLRALGIPARLVTGYATGDYDPVLNQAVVRERDAHAWVEVYFPGHGWVPVDPSPGYSALAATRFPNRWAAAGVARLIPHLTVGAGLAGASALGFIALVPGAIAVVVVLVLGLGWLLSRRLRRPSPADDLLGVYLRLQRRLRRYRAPPETPREYRDRAASGSLDDVLEEVTAAVNRGLYADRWPEPGEVARWRKRISSSRG